MSDCPALNKDMVVAFVADHFSITDMQIPGFLVFPGFLVYKPFLLSKVSAISRLFV